MKKILFLLAVSLFAADLAAQNLITVDRLNPFSRLQVSGRIELFITMDSEQPAGMSIDMKGNDPNLLKWWEEEGALQIKYTAKSKSTPILIRLNTHPLESMDIQAASVTVEPEWVKYIVTINVGSGGRLTATVQAKDIRVSTQTNAAAVLKGKADYADFDVRSKSTLDARAFEAVSATLRSGGFSESYVYGRERLIVDAYDGAAVFFRGNPEILRQRSSRGGHINPIGE